MQLDQIRQLPHHLTLTIPESYLDIFEHMNVQYYLKTFNDSVFEMCNQLNMTESYFLDNQVALFAIDQRLSYKAEVKAGATVSTYSRLLARSSKSLHFMVFMVNDTTNELSSTLEGLALHVSRETKRTTPFLPDAITSLDARLANEQALDWDVPLSQKIVVRRN